MRFAAAALCLFACGRGVSRDCAQLESQYAFAVPTAQECDTTASDPCNAQAYSTIAPSCSCCFTPVTPAGAQALDSIYEQSKSEGCPGPQDVACPAIVKVSQCVSDGIIESLTSGHCQ
jgi:hypothetical protein